MASNRLHDEILELEERTWVALQKNGAALTPYLTKDAIMQFPLGMKVTAQTEPSIRDILHSEAFVPWKTFALSKINVTPVGTDGAVISYLANATRPPVGPEAGEPDVPFEALCSSVWRREGGDWFMCFHQQTLTT